MMWLWFWRRNAGKMSNYNDTQPQWFGSLCFHQQCQEIKQKQNFIYEQEQVAESLLLGVEFMIFLIMIYK
jgi:hypothetical protein